MPERRRSPLSAAPLGGAIDFLPSDSKASPGDAAGAALLPPEPGPQIAEKPGPQLAPLAEQARALLRLVHVRLWCGWS